jgi:hypothetical protein
MLVVDAEMEGGGLGDIYFSRFGRNRALNIDIPSSYQLVISCLKRAAYENSRLLVYEWSS